MADIIRKSPVAFDPKPLEVEQRGNWQVVLTYADQGQGPHLVDWSHCAKWDLQHHDLSTLTPWNVQIPESPGQVVFADGMLVNRMNRTQASIWRLSANDLQLPGDEAAYTETTDVTAGVALIGSQVFAILEKLTALDLADPQKQPPFLLQGPVAHVPCQVVVFQREPADSVVLFTCSRGYGHDMVHALLAAGDAFDLRPAGEKVLTAALGLSGS